MRITCNNYNNRRTQIKCKNKNELLTTESLLIVAKAMPMQVFHNTNYCPLMQIPFCHLSTKLHNNQSIPDLPVSIHMASPVINLHNMA